MKWLFFLLLAVLSFNGNAQTSRSSFTGYRIYHCERYIVEQIAKRHEGLLDTFARQIISPTVKTIYVARTAYIKSVPDTMNGYHLKLVDVDSSAKSIYRELKDKTAILLYLTDGMNLYQQYTIWVMPVSLNRKGKRYFRNYELTPSCKVIFGYNDATGLYSVSNIEYL